MRRSRRPAGAIVALLAFATLAAIGPSGAAAISDDEELVRVGGGGSEAGGLNLPVVAAGIASDPRTGHIYAVEGANLRISEFTPWGGFVKAFGWDVAPAAVNEQQEVRIRASTGQFKLSFGAETTADLDLDASASEVQGALEALGAISAGGVSVAAAPGNVNGTSPFIYVITFKGALAGSNVAQLGAVNGTTPPSGGVPTTELAALTRAEGTPGGTGLESCTMESVCKAGLSGGGRGQLSSALGVAIDAEGNLYVREVGNLRVQKFDSAGRFVLMFGGDVNTTKVESGAPEAERNICPVDPADVCHAGTSGTGNGQFESGFSGGIALCSGSLFVADKDRIQRYSLAGGFEASPVPVPGKNVLALACDPVGGELYATFEAEANVHRFDPITGAEVDEIDTKGNSASALATDSDGNLFMSVDKVFELDSSGDPLSPPSCCEAPPSGRLVGLGTNIAGNLHVAEQEGGDNFIRIFGPPPVAFEPPPQVPPSITAQFAGSVERTSAVLAADVNPHFWSNTRYYFEYGTGKCSEGGCEETKPLPPGTILTQKVLDAPVRTAGIPLEGLTPGTTYHYRFVAQSSGGSSVGEEGSFTTYPSLSPPKSDCPNQAFRTGFSAPLPDCRAYEMVSPIDKNNGDIATLLDFGNFDTALDQSSGDGERFTYSSYRAFADPEAAPYTIQYMAERTAGVGWSSEALNPPQAPSGGLNEFTVDNPYKAFSPDLCSGWLAVVAEPALAPGAAEGKRNLYRRDDCGSKGFEALIQSEPPVDFFPNLQGTSDDGREAILGSNSKLTDDAAPDGVFQTYYASEGELGLLCILPSGLPSPNHCSGGTGPTPPSAQTRERWANLTNTISDDGSRVYWTDSGGSGFAVSEAGKVYLRLNPGEEQSALSGGQCTEPEKACTVKVSETGSSKESRFLSASSDGSRALFEVVEGAQKGSISRFDLEAGSSESIAAKGLGVAGTSEDLSRIYFASEEDLPETSGAIAGEPNLYLDEEGVKTFIATLSEADARPESTVLSNSTWVPIAHAARATADGSRLAFVSEEPLSGYDNADQSTGEASLEVYLYEAGSAGPVCVSCNPSGARPQGRPLGVATLGSQSTAAWIPTPQSSLDAPRVLSSDGRRLFFNSYDALLPRDTNGKADVYQWQEASSAGECQARGADLYVSSSGGCLSLISSGQSPTDSLFRDASANGRDVFFTTNASLVTQDPGLVDVYDAREGGGLPPPPEPLGRCQGEACQLAPAPPTDPTPASASFKGTGNAKPASRCRKGKVARKGRCVTRKRKKVRKQANRKRAANNKRGTGR